MDLESLYLSNQNLVYSCLQRYFGKSAVWNEDVVQSGFVGLWRALQRYQEKKGTLGQWTWFWIRKEVQRHLNEQGMPVIDIEENIEGYIYADSEEKVYVEELRVILNKFLNRYLNDKEREIVIRRVMYEESFIGIAKAMDIHVLEVKEVFKRAMQVLRQYKQVLRDMLEGV